jgi:hypothetical protein
MLWGFTARASEARALERSSLIENSNRSVRRNISAFPRSVSHCGSTLLFNGAAAYG